MANPLLAASSNWATLHLVSIPGLPAARCAAPRRRASHAGASGGCPPDCFRAPTPSRSGFATSVSHRPDTRRLRDEAKGREQTVALPQTRAEQPVSMGRKRDPTSPFPALQSGSEKPRFRYLFASLDNKRSVEGQGRIGDNSEDRRGGFPCGGRLNSIGFREIRDFPTSALFAFEIGWLGHGRRP